MWMWWCRRRRLRLTLIQQTMNIRIDGWLVGRSVPYSFLMKEKHTHTHNWLCSSVCVVHICVSISLWLTRWCTKIHTHRDWGIPKTLNRAYTRTRTQSHTLQPNSSHCLRSQCKWQNVYTFEQHSTAQQKTKNTDTNTYDAIRSNTHKSIVYTPFTCMWCAFYVRWRRVYVSASCIWTIWLRCCCALVVVVVACSSLSACLRLLFWPDSMLLYGWLADWLLEHHSVQAVVHVVSFDLSFTARSSYSFSHSHFALLFSLMLNFLVCQIHCVNDQHSAFSNGAAELWDGIIKCFCSAKILIMFRT